MQAMTQAVEPSASTLNGPLAFIMLLGAVLALPISFGLIRLYRRAVTNSMRTRASAPTVEAAPLPTTTPPRRPARLGPDVIVFDHSSLIHTEPEAGALFSEVMHAPWRAAAIYGVAGACQALIMATTYHASLTGSGFSLLTILFLFCIFAWPVVLTINLVAAATRRARLLAAAIYFLTYAAVCAIAVAGNKLEWKVVIVLWLGFNVPTTLLLLTFLNRRVRAVGPLVLIFLLVASVGLQLGLSTLFVAERAGALRSVVDAGSFVGLGAVGIFFGLAAVGFVIAWPIGWLTLRWVRSRYERKKISDQSITIDAIWLLFAVVFSLIIASKDDLWMLSGILAFLGYKVVARVGFALFGRGDDTRQSTKLLLLRVFALGKRSEQLFGALAMHWRHVGSIQLIAGPDLATETVEPHEFLDFLSRKLARRFINGPQTLAQRISEADAGTDRDGRYRVNDFFCHDDTWQMVLTRLVGESDAVLMDLRGFSSQNAGCVYEINELINTVPLARFELIIDETTDESFLRQILRESWTRMRTTSPNSRPAAEQLRLFRYTGSHNGDLHQLLRSLCVAAKTA